METDKVRLRTYKQVWSTERVIYQIERVRLPFPVTFRQAGVFAAAVLVMFVVGQLPPFNALSALIRYLIIPGAASWYLTSQRLDGKSPLLWVRSMVRFLLSPKRLNRLRPMPAVPARLRFRGAIAYRKG